MSDDLEVLAGSLKDSRPAQLQGAMARGLTFDPTAYSKAVQTAAKTGVVPTAVLPNQKEFDQAEVMPNPGEFVNLNPKAAAWLLAHEDHAAQAHDDLGSLVDLEHVQQPRPEGVTDSQWRAIVEERQRVQTHNANTNEIESFIQANTAGLTSIVAGAARGLSRLAEGADTAADTVVAALTGQEKLANPSPGHLLNDFANFTQDKSRVKIGPSPQLVDPLTGQPFDNPDAAVTGNRTLDRQVFNRDAWNSLSTIPAELGKFVLGGKVLEGAGMTEQVAHKALAYLYGAHATVTTQEAARQRRATLGLPENPLADVGEGLIGGAATYGLMGMTPAPTATDTLLGDIVQKVGRAAVLGPSMSMIGNAAARLHGDSPDLTEGALGSFAGFLPWEGMGTLDRMMNIAATSKLKARSPEAFQDATATILKDSPVENVMIPADRLATYFQEKGLDPAREAARIGAKNYTEALAAGTDVVIPTADFLAKLQPADHAGLLPDLRTNPEHMTQREAEAYQQDAPARVAQLVETAKAELPDEQFQAFTTIKAEFQNRLEATGRFTPAIAEDNAALIAKGLVTLSMREGLDPLKEMERYGLNIIGPGGEGSPMRPAMATQEPDLTHWQSIIDPEAGKPTLNSGADHGHEASTEAALPTARPGEVPGPDQGNLSGDVRPHWDAATRTWRGSDYLGPQPTRFEGKVTELAPDSRLQDYQRRNIPVLDVNGVEVAGGPRPPYFSFHGTEIKEGGPHFSESKSSISGEGVYLASTHTDASKFSAHGEGSVHSLYTDTSKLVSFDAREARTYSPEELKAFGIDSERAMNGVQLHHDLVGEHGGGKGISDYLKTLGFNGIAYDMGGKAPAWAVFDPRIFKNVADASNWTPEEIKRREAFDPKPLGAGGTQIEDNQTLYQRDFKPTDIRTPEFKAWLGNDSNLVRPNGSPMELYHGTDHDFTQFKESDRGAMGSGIYLAQAPEAADGYGNRLVPVYARGKYLDNGQWTDYIDKYGWGDARKEAIKDGFAGVRDNKFEDAVVVWDPKNIKSSLSNTGAFDPNNPSILHQPGDNRGSITFGPDNKVAISVLEKADASTFVHELGHFWLKMQSDLAARPEASDQQKADLATILKWMGVTSPAEITTEHHEQFARAHEAYLREGKAPSQEMQGTFARFKTWLSAVYQKLTSLNVHLSDDVRGIFDRIYASDAEIESAKQQMGGDKPIFETPEKAGMTPEQFDAYSATRTRADDSAKGALAAQLNREAQRDQLQWWKDEIAKVKEQVAAQVDADPVQRAFKSLSEGKTEDGQPIKLSKQALVDQFGDGILKDLPRHGAKWVYDARGGGMDAESAAEFLGFKSGTDLVESLKAMAPRKERIQADADLLMKQKHGDMLTDGSIADAAVEALHNADREKALMTELKALRKLQGQAKADKAEARSTVKEIPPMQTFRDAAKELVDQTSVRDLDSNRYIIASRKASREAFTAMAKDDYQTAADAKQRELLNHHLYLEAVKAKAEAQDIADYGKEGSSLRFQGMLGKAGDAREQWNALAGRYEFSRVPYKTLDDRKTLESWAQEQAAAGEEIAFDPAVYNETRAKNWREVPMSELRAVKDALKNIETIARRHNQVGAEGKRIDFDAAVEQMQRRAKQSLESKAVPIGGSTLSLAEKIAGKRRTINGALLPMEQIIDWMDGGDVKGPWHEMLMNRASDAQTKEHELALKLASPIQEALKAIPAKTLNGLLDFTGIRLPGMDRDLNRKQLISVALNRGNEQNWEKLLHGRGWTSMEAQGELGRGLDMLTRPEWEFVQKTWDAMESLRPEVGALQRKMTGIEPEWVEARPFLARTPEGETVDMRGGYYPLVAERGESTVGMRQDLDASKSVMDSGSGYQRASTSTGYTKDRTKATYPLLLDFEQIVTQHASKVAKDLAYREFLVDANKLVTDQRVRNAIRETLGPEYEKQFMPWLRYQGNNRNGSAVQGMGDLSRWMMQLRANTVVATMGFNVGTTLIQFSGLTRAQHYVSGTHLLKGLSEFLAHPVETTRMVRELSGEMMHRGENYDRDMAGVMRNELPDSLVLSSHPSVRGVVLPAVKIHSDVMKFAFHGILLADVALGIPTWLGAYRQGLATHGNPEQAILEGDRAVRMTLPAAGAKDLAPVMRNNEFWKMATMFYGHFTKLYSNLADSQHRAGVMAGKGDYLGATGQAASTALLTVLIPAIAGAYFKNRGPQDGENKAEWAIEESLHFAASSIPILRNIADSLKSGGDFKFSPMFGAFEQQVRAIRSIDKAVTGDGDWQQAGFDAAAAFGQTAGIGGTTQMLKPLKYERALSRGTQPTPDNTYQHVKNAVFGPPPKVKQ